jgi:HSP20 family protein
MPVLDQWTPFVDLDAIEQRMRRLFPGLVVAPGFVPAVEIDETEEQIVIELEVPGFDESELAVEVIDLTLIVKGAREVETETIEFERRFQLPVEVDTEKLDATYGKGVLTVHVPKSAPRAPRSVPIAIA